MMHSKSPTFARAVLVAALSVVLAIPLFVVDSGVAADSGQSSLLPRNPAVKDAADWKLIFHDEFNGAFLNGNKWSRLRGNHHKYGSPFNRRIESAAYNARNATQRNGNAVLTVKRRPAKNYPRFPYSSGMIQSGPRFSFRYGYMEARVKVPSCSGCWPAFWMMENPPDSNWPPEIDVFEFFDTARDQRPYFNLHYAEQGKHRQIGIKKYGNPGQSYVDNWNVYGLLWTPDTIQIFINGESGPTYNDPTRIPDQAKYLIFNLAVQRGKRPRSGSKMLIDWVRVWQPAG